MTPFYYILSVNGLLFILSLALFFLPPKSRNTFYGYKTNRTIVNQKIWDFANAFFTKQLLIYAFCSLIGALILGYINPEITWQPMALMLLALGVSVIKTEQELNKFFDKDGNDLK